MTEREALAAETVLPAEFLMEVSATYTAMAEKITGEPVTMDEDPRAALVALLDREYGLIDDRRAVQGSRRRYQ